MTKQIEKFLAFCDANRIGFEVKYRHSFRDPNARFFLVFDSFHDLQVLGAEDFKAFHFSDGRTPNEAIENCIRELHGKTIRFAILACGNMAKEMKMRIFP